MEWLDQSEFEINEFGDRLEIVARTETGMLGKIVFAAGSLVAVFAFAKSIPILGVLVAGIAVFTFFNAIRKGNETHLTVRSDAFVLEGSGSKRLTVPVSDIYGIGYFAGGEDEPSGLYAFKPLSRVCLVPRAEESECQRIKAGIESKFPSMEFGKEPISGLFGDGPEIITLGLNKPAIHDSDPPIL